MEMSNGFVVFTCRDFRSLEVWRWAIDQRKDPVECEPEPQQVEMYQVCVTDNFIYSALILVSTLLGRYEVCWILLVF